MGAGGDAPVRGALLARPGTVAGDLNKRAGDFVVRAATSSRTTRSPAAPRSPAQIYIELARRFEKSSDPLVRQELVRLHVLREIIRLNTERHKAVRGAGGDIAGIANFSKLAMATIVRLQRDLGLQILGARGMLHAYDDDGRAVVAAQAGGAAATLATGQALSAQALPIFGGTDQIQRNIIGERTLGLPKEPGDLSHLPFSEMPKNS